MQTQQPQATNEPGTAPAATASLMTIILATLAVSGLILGIVLAVVLARRGKGVTGGGGGKRAGAVSAT